MRYGVTMFVTDLSIGVVELARAAEERGFDSLWLPEHTHIPTSRHDPAPVGRAELPEKYKRSLDPLVALGAAAARHDHAAARHRHPAARPARPDRHGQGGRHARPRCRAAGSRSASASAGTRTRSPTTASTTATAGRVAREHVLAMQALWGDDEASLRRRARAASRRRGRGPSPSQADAAGGRASPCWSAAAPGRSCSPTSSSTPTGGCPIGGAGLSPTPCPTCGPRWPRPAATRPRSRSSRSRPIPDHGKLDHYDDLGVTETRVRPAVGAPRRGPADPRPVRGPGGRAAPGLTGDLPHRGPIDLPAAAARGTLSTR